jgi:peptidoglycan hydrolase-like protein with peptidoglycan-binding domain
MVGTDVAALQINLNNAIVDGDFGKKTEAAVTQFQYRHDLEDDGIAGPVTQNKLVSSRSGPINKENGFPKGLLKSIASNESGFFVGSMGFHGNDAGLDVGVFARSTGSQPGSQEFYRSAYNVKESAEWTAKNLKETRQELPSPISSWYLTNVGGGDKNKFLWQLAIFNHNWPAGALNIAKNGQATSNDDADAQWIINATMGRLRTPRQWVCSYIERATVYIRW